jgi:hypothetical protein
MRCSWLGCTTGSLLALVLPGLVAACDGDVALRVGGVTLLALGVLISVAGILRLAWLP